MLAYSGGLDTSVALRWLAEEYGAEVVALLVDVGQGVERETVTRRALAAGAADVVIADAREEFAREFVAADPSGRRPLRGPLSARLGALAPADRPASRRASPARSAPRPSPTAAPARATTRCGSRPPSAALAPDLAVLAPVRDWGMTREQEIAYAERARHRGAREARRRVLDRPEPVGAVDRGRPARGSLGCAARGGLRAHAAPERAVPRAAGGRDHVRGGRARWPSTARSWASSS